MKLVARNIAQWWDKLTQNTQLYAKNSWAAKFTAEKINLWHFFFNLGYVSIDKFQGNLTFIDRWERNNLVVWNMVHKQKQYELLGYFIFSNIRILLDSDVLVLGSIIYFLNSLIYTFIYNHILFIYINFKTFGGFLCQTVEKSAMQYFFSYYDFFYLSYAIGPLMHLS